MGKFRYCPDRKCKYIYNPGRAGGSTEVVYLEDINCPKCGGKMVVKEGKFGNYSSCENNKGRNKDGSLRGTCTYSAKADGSPKNSPPSLVIGKCWTCKDCNIYATSRFNNIPEIKCENYWHPTDSSKLIPVKQVVEKLGIDEKELIKNITEFFGDESGIKTTKLYYVEKEKSK